MTFTVLKGKELWIEGIRAFFSLHEYLKLSNFQTGRLCLTILHANLAALQGIFLELPIPLLWKQQGINKAVVVCASSWARLKGFFSSMVHLLSPFPVGGTFLLHVVLCTSQ